MIGISDDLRPDLKRTDEPGVWKCRWKGTRYDVYHHESEDTYSVGVGSALLIVVGTKAEARDMIARLDGSKTLDGVDLPARCGPKCPNPPTHRVWWRYAVNGTATGPDRMTLSCADHFIDKARRLRISGMTRIQAELIPKEDPK